MWESPIRRMRSLLVCNLAVLVANVVEAMTHPQSASSSSAMSDTVVVPLGVAALIAYAIGFVGLWVLKSWGRVFFAVFLVALIALDEPSSDATRLSLIVEDLLTASSAFILGVAFFGFPAGLGIGQRAVKEVFS